MTAPTTMDPDDHVCLCFRVSLRKLVHFMNRTEPTVPSQLSECLGAGTGCRWCVPFLKSLHESWRIGEVPDLPVSPEEYARRRAIYRSTPPAPPGRLDEVGDEGASSDDHPRDAG